MSSNNVLKKRKRCGRHTVVLGDLNARVENEEVLGVMWTYNEPGSNVSDERLLGKFSAMEIMICSTYFQEKGINIFTLRSYG